MQDHKPPEQTTGWAPTAAQLALELAQQPLTDNETFVEWVERHAKRYLVVVREAERQRYLKAVARVGNAGDYRTMAIAQAIMQEIEDG